MRNIVIVVLLAAAGASFAQPVWRCGNTYGAVPCEGGTVVGKPAPVSPEDSARARAVGQADARLAASLETTRLAEEKRAPKAVIPPIAAASANVKPADRKPAGKKPMGKKKPELLTAVRPESKPKKSK